MDVAAMSDGQQRALASDPQTDPETLARLSKSWTMCPAVVENPGTPPELREQIYRNWPELRPKPELPVAAPVDRPVVTSGPRPADVDRAIAGFRARSASDYRRKTDAEWRRRGSPQYAELFDAAGRTVRVPVNVRPATNAFAITSLITSLVGLGVLGVIFGHIAKKQISETGDNGDGMATAGLVIGYLSIICFVILVWL